MKRDAASGSEPRCYDLADSGIGPTPHGHRHSGQRARRSSSATAPIVTLTFNRPEARNAMTWDMYQRLVRHLRGGRRRRLGARPGAQGRRRQGLRRRHRHRPVHRRSRAATTGCATSATATGAPAGIARVSKPVIAQIQGYAVGGGFGIAAGADLRDRDARRALRRADRAHARQLPVDAGLCALRRPARAVALEGADLHRPADAAPTKRSPPASSTRSSRPTRSRRACASSPRRSPRTRRSRSG